MFYLNTNNDSGTQIRIIRIHKLFLTVLMKDSLDIRNLFRCKSTIPISNYIVSMDGYIQPLSKALFDVNDIIFAFGDAYASFDNEALNRMGTTI